MARIAICIPSKRGVSLKWCLALIKMLKETEKFHQVAIVSSHLFNIDVARTDCVRQAIALNADWIFFLDDDVRCPPEIINKLVADCEVGQKLVGTGIYISVPFPVMYPTTFKYNDNGNGKTDTVPINVEGDGLTTCDFTGLGCCLISSTVFRRLLPDGWFSYIYQREGVEGTFQGEDSFFFWTLYHRYPGMRPFILVDKSQWCVHEKTIDFEKKHFEQGVQEKEVERVWKSQDVSK